MGCFIFISHIKKSAVFVTTTDKHFNGEMLSETVKAKGNCMSNKLYVGNLSFSTTEDKLRDLFSQYGTVESVKIIKDEIGRSKGFAFVEMSSESEASDAAKNLNGNELDGRTIRVDLARPQEARPRTSSGPRGGGSSNGGERRGGFRSSGNW